MHLIYNKPDDLTPLLSVCYDVAADAHLKMVRTKKSGGIPYITHPTIVYKLLRLVGVDDELTLAASFLHDVMEDCEKYKVPGALKNELVEKFREVGLVDADKTAYLISEICEELTNAEYMAEGKRGWQWEHGQRLSPRAKAVKIADQAASLVDDILMPSDRSYEKLRKFDMKALECAKACAGGNELLDDVFKVIFKTATAVLDHEKPPANEIEIARLRKSFSLESALEEARNLPPAKKDETPIRWRRHPANTEAKTGILNVGITENGGVCRFAMLVDPELDETSACNRAVAQLIERLESVSPNRVTYQPMDIIDGRVARSFKLKPSMALQQFIDNARTSSSIEDTFALSAAKPTNSREI